MVADPMVCIISMLNEQNSTAVRIRDRLQCGKSTQEMYYTVHVKTLDLTVEYAFQLETYI